MPPEIIPILIVGVLPELIVGAGIVIILCVLKARNVWRQR